MVWYLDNPGAIWRGVRTNLAVALLKHALCERYNQRTKPSFFVRLWLARALSWKFWWRFFSREQNLGTCIDSHRSKTARGRVRRVAVVNQGTGLDVPPWSASAFCETRIIQRQCVETVGEERQTTHCPPRNHPQQTGQTRFPSIECWWLVGRLIHHHPPKHCLLAFSRSNSKR